MTSFIISGHEIGAPPLEPALYIVATPIGNLSDITLRALETLAACNVLACEDTRITRRLLDRYGIRQKPYAYHEHNAAKAGPRLMQQLKEGKSVALVSDAGTPLISDPGYRLALEARSEGIQVIPIPGASAVLAGLSASGLPTDDFRFVGFLPVKQGAKQSFLEALANTPSTLIMFEAPTRLKATLKAIAAVMGEERRVCVARELTKRFETIRSAKVKELIDCFESETVKGEIVLLVEPALQTKKMLSEDELDDLLRSLLSDHSPSNAAKEAARLTGMQKSTLYSRLLKLKDHFDEQGG